MLPGERMTRANLPLKLGLKCRGEPVVDHHPSVWKGRSVEVSHRGKIPGPRPAERRLLGVSGVADLIPPASRTLNAPEPLWRRACGSEQNGDAVR